MKFTMPKFSGGPNPEDYLSWALKVDKIYRVHNYDEAKKVAMASLEFEDYALNWWEQVQDLRVEQGLPQVCTWEEMKQVMRLRFVPQHYTRDLYQRLQTLKQGYKTVEEYYKEMELAMIRANVKESEEQTMARFLNGLNYQVKKITNFQPYKTIQELVHQATKAERQVQEDAKYSKFMSSNTRVTTPSASTLPRGPPPSGGPSSTRPPDPSSTRNSSSTPNFKPRESPNSFPPRDTKTSSIQCFTCKGRGHKTFECPTKRTMILNEDGEYDSISEGEMDALIQVHHHTQANDEEVKQVYCDNDASPSLVVSKVLTLQQELDENQRCHIFHTKAGIQGRSVKVIIDGGSCHNLASEELCSKLNLIKKKHPHPYKVQWLSDSGSIKVDHTVEVSFKIGAYEDTLVCDVVPMTVCHILLGRPWQYDRSVLHNGRNNHYCFKWKGQDLVLHPMTPSPVLTDKVHPPKPLGDKSERDPPKRE